jgi:hypothetical protein
VCEPYGIAVKVLRANSHEVGVAGLRSTHGGGLGLFLLGGAGLLVLQSRRARSPA